MGRRLLIAVPFLWLFVLFFVPFVMVLRIALSDYALAQPPYAPHFDGDIWALLGALDFENFRFIAEDSLYLNAYLSSVQIAGISTLMCLAIGYPLAYGMARAPKRWQPLLVLLVILPFWTSFLIRVYAWIGILKTEGLLNQALLGLGVIDAPLMIHNTPWAVYIGIVYAYLPFMVLPLFSVMRTINPSYVRAARSLGATSWTAFRRIYLPQCVPGIGAGALL
ncbi:MAG: ABC transporter permease, partial [Pseudomonadota bacterium]